MFVVAASGDPDLAEGHASGQATVERVDDVVDVRTVQVVPRHDADAPIHFLTFWMSTLKNDRSFVLREKILDTGSSEILASPS